MTSPYDTGRFADVSDAALASVQTRGDVARVVELMISDLQACPTEWENHTLENFLEAPGACLTDRVGLARKQHGAADSSRPSWQLLAELLVVASGYE